jgi:DNA topoisomerase-2
VVRGIAKLDDANLAGTGRSMECTLILTEGDSAKTMALAGLSVVGRDKYGVFPLRGKLLNVKDAALAKVMQNEEITALKKIMGLESGKTYTSLNDLRYGRIMVMTDQDVDGSHIKGLIFNVFHTMWPSLFANDKFMQSMLTPIVKARKAGASLSFYTMADYKRWCETDPASTSSAYKVKSFQYRAQQPFCFFIFFNADEPLYFFNVWKIILKQHEGAYFINFRRPIFGEINTSPLVCFSVPLNKI